MPAIEFIHPEGLPKLPSYTQVVVAHGGKTVFIAGQVAYDANRNIVGGADLRLQARQAYQNLKIALAAAGATFADVVKVNTYVVNYKPADREILADLRDEFFHQQDLPAWTLVGVQSLALPEFLIEIEAIAVVD